MPGFMGSKFAAVIEECNQFGSIKEFAVHLLSHKAANQSSFVTERSHHCHHLVSRVVRKLAFHRHFHLDKG